MIKKLLLLVVLTIAGYLFLANNSPPPAPQPDRPAETPAAEVTQPAKDYSDSEKLLQFAFENQQSDLQVEGRGEVTALLKDDNKGSRHQRFILQLTTGQTLLVAHNIDLAPRLDNLGKGDTVDFYGEYEWNAKGGVIHWTHHDPQGTHPDGWLRHQGVIYQ